jgi:hypothetical protein
MGRGNAEQLQTLEAMAELSCVRLFGQPSTIHRLCLRLSPLPASSLPPAAP